MVINKTLPMCHPQDPSNICGKIDLRDQRILFHCWGSPSFMMNLALRLILIGISIGIT